MLFNSIEFLIFFPIVCLIHFILPKKTRWVWLLFASYYFYMCWNPRYALLIFASTLITWLSGIFIAKYEKHKKLSVAFSFILNLGILFFFKYWNFAFENINHILSHFGFGIMPHGFDVILPVGISFYTFQALSYTMDVYRKEVAPEKNLFRYMLFVSFFPQLVAGPIERSKNLLSQLNTPHSFNGESAKRGLLLMLWGFFQKLVIADRLAIAVNTVYNNPTGSGGVEIAVATIFFALQIYCDFSSYTDIARGAAEVLGIKLCDNFRQPYFAVSIADFWRRWHISLSGWLKDYLYIPLGGSRRGRIRKYLNIMIVFLSSGLWHGANWHFVFWGALHGVYQIIGDITLPAREKICSLLSIDRSSFHHKAIRRAITFCLVCIGWIFFRADSISDALYMTRSLFLRPNPWILTDGGIFSLGLDVYQLSVAAAAVSILFFVSCAHIYQRSVRSMLLGTNIFFRYTVIFLLLFTVLIFGIYGPGYSESQFIYFQF